MTQQKRSTESFSYKCLKVVQRDTKTSPSFVLFSAEVGQVLQWAAIERFTDTTQAGPQRIEKPYKVSAIDKFFEASESNTIPTAVVIGFRRGQVKLTKIPGCDGLHDLTVNVDDENKSATIVDGQHRILGINRFDPKTLVNIVGLLDADDTETAFQFLVINNKAAKVSSDHLRALALHYKEKDLAQRLQKVRLNLDPNLRFVGYCNELPDSPFKGILALPNNPKARQIVSPAAIEDSVDYLRSQKLPDFLEDDDMVVGVFFTIWRVVKAKWASLWNPESHLLDKVSVIILSQFVVDNLMRQFDWNNLDIFDPAAVEREVARILDVLEPTFWDKTTEWTAKGLDTPAGRKILSEALEQMVRNARQKALWYTDIKMIRRSGA